MAELTLEEVENELIRQERELDYMLSPENIPRGPDELVDLIRWNNRLGTLLREYQKKLLEKFIIDNEGGEAK